MRVREHTVLISVLRVVIPRKIGGQQSIAPNCLNIALALALLTHQICASQFAILRLPAEYCGNFRDVEESALALRLIGLGILLGFVAHRSPAVTKLALFCDIFSARKKNKSSSA